MFMHLLGKRTLGRIVGIIVAFFCVLTGSLAALAQPITNDEIPPDLRAWIPWVKAELGEDACTLVGDSKRCQWPGVLELELKEEGGTFTLYAEMDTRGLRPIVGGSGAWPQNVRVNGELRPVVASGGAPAVLLDVGRHKITGSLMWSRLPETLHVGADVAFINLSVVGKDVPLVRRENDKIWLKGLGIERLSAGEPEHVELAVFRQLRDGVPLLVETRLIFQVAGKARELSLPHPLLDGTIPLSVSGDLAIALEPSGALRVQLVPGRHEIHLLARSSKHGEPLRSRARVAPWPEQEIWTFRPSAELRSVELNGLIGIDASRTELPSEWRADGAYIARADSVLELTTTRRGEAQIPQNKLHFQREFWLDETAQGYTVRDSLSGSMHQGWRLNLLSGELGSVRVGSDDQLITSAQGLTGVEIRDGALNMVAVSRVPRTKELSAVGWSEDAATLSAVFHLPPGWDVFSVTGVDTTSATWLSRWDLFDVFYLLLVTFSMFRLTGAVGGSACAIALVLCHEEAGAPEYVWLPLVALAALLSLIKEGRLRSWLSFLLYALGIYAIVSVVAFSVDQVRLALYPHLASDASSSAYFPGGIAEKAQYATLSEPASPEPAPEEVSLPAEDAAAVLGQVEAGAPPPPVQAKRYASSDLRRREAPLSKEGGSGLRQLKDSYQKQHKSDAIVQTGPGIPEISGHSVQLSWSGPVVQGHKISLWLVSPNMNRFLTALRLVSLAGLLFFLYQLAKNPGGKPRRGAKLRKNPAVATALVCAAFLCFSPARASADEPSDERLAQLKERLSKKAECFPHCVSVSLMKISVADAFTAMMEVHAGATSAYRLPGPAKILSQAEILIDGSKATALRLEADGAYYLRIPEGVHQVVLKTSLNSDRFTMDVGTLPERVEIAAEGWQVSGVNEEGQVPGGTLTWQRQMAPQGKPAESAREENRVAVPAFFHVERHLRLHVTGAITTEVRRISDASSPEVMKLKLLPGERLTTPGIEVKNGVAELSFSREETIIELSSTIVLPPTGKDLEVTLVAPEAAFGSETWKIECGVVYHCTTSGVVASSHLEEGRAVYYFQPWPNETLKIHATEPAPAAGTSLTVHRAVLTLQPGVRSSQGRLEVTIQTSRSLVHTFSIPKSARLEGVTVDGRQQAVKSEEGKVRVSLSPGTALVTIEWHEPEGLKTLFSSSEVHTGASGVNFRTVIDLPAERWLLLVGGPPRGPALLFWGYLLLIVGAALLLPRIAYSHLKTREWLLLGLGLTQVPAAVAVFVAGWFFAVSSRTAWPYFGRRRQNLLQLGLVFYTLFFLLALGGAVYSGLVSSPDMEVQGAGSYNGHLVFLVDRSAGSLPHAWVLSASIWVWRAFMLLWALWLAWALLGWLKWAYGALNQGGFWVPKPVKAPQRTPDAPLASETGEALTKGDHLTSDSVPTDTSTSND